MSGKSIQANTTKAEGKKRRRTEIILGIGAFLLIVLFSWIELKFFGVNSHLFLAVFNLNLILLLVILFLVLRNGVKLFLERRRNVRGSRLRTRLVLAFITLSIIPTVLMFLVAVKFVQTSVDYWFRSQVDNSMEQALEVGKAFYSRTKERLGNRAEYIVDTIRRRELLWGAQGMDEYLVRKSREYGFSLIGVLRPGDLGEQNWHASEEWSSSWPKIKQSLDWSSLREEPSFRTHLLSGSEKDMMVGIMPVDEARTGFLVLGTTIGQGLLTKLDQILQGVHEYKKLKTLKNPLKIAFYLILGIMTLLILFGAMWFGFRLAKEISAPIQALSIGTRRIADGDLGVRVDDESGDELGMLVQSFNTMAEDLEQSQQRLNQANRDLAKQNIELEQRRKYMEAVLNNITSGVVSLDKEGCVSTVNRAAEEILNTGAQTLKGRTPEQLLSGEHLEMYRAVEQRLRDSPNTQWQRQLDVRVAGEDRKLLVNIVSLRASYGEDLGKVMVFEDITELDRMQRMAAWREVARRIAHEIKNPLTPIKLSAQRLQRKYGHMARESTFEECTGLIVRQVEHLQQMVKEFSSFAKLPEVTPTQNEVQPLLQEVLTLFRNSYTQIDWRLETDNGVPPIRFDRAAMKTVFINLLTNAAEALKSQAEPQVRIGVHHLPDSGLLRVEIGDNGPGLEPEDRRQLFEPYFSRKKGNTGLGLTIVKSIVNDHRGYVRVARNEPRGSVFIVELPA
jgi:two-component system nitrogen regulation sensor histidine kinase NtrY